MTILVGKIACGNFVKRQTPDSGSSHFEGSWEELEQLTTDIYFCNHSQVRTGYKDGVILVDFVYTAHRFRSAIITLDEHSKLKANYAPRRTGEEPFIRVSAKGEKQVARHASVVLYRWDVLAENNERETDAEWEIVCIKARADEAEEPMDPYTMTRNFLHLAGGTKGNFSAEDFAQSIYYWNNHVMVMSKRKWYRRVIDFFRRRN